MGKSRGVTFTHDSAVRIARTVRKSEGLQSQPIRARRQYSGVESWRILTCKSVGACLQGEASSCEIWDGEDQATFAATGQEISVYFRIGAADAGVWVYVAETVRGYEAIAVECDA